MPGMGVHLLIRLGLFVRNTSRVYRYRLDTRQAYKPYEGAHFQGELARVKVILQGQIYVNLKINFMCLKIVPNFGTIHYHCMYTVQT